MAHPLARPLAHLPAHPLAPPAHHERRALPVWLTKQGWVMLRIHYSAIPDYDYEDACKGLSEAQIRQELECDWTATSHKRIFPEFGDMHIADRPIRFDRTRPLVCGWDFGDTPAWVPTQLQATGQWAIFPPIVGDPDRATGLYEFATTVYEHLIREYCEPYRLPYERLSLAHFGDPAGNQKILRSRAKADEGMELRTSFQILDRGMEIVTGYDRMGQAVTESLPGWGWKVQPGAVSITTRLEAIRSRLITNLNGRPALLVDPRADTIIEGFQGGYHFKRRQDGTYEDKPEKNWYSHPMDALQYPATRLFKAPPKGSLPPPPPRGVEFSSHASISAQRGY